MAVFLGVWETNSLHLGLIGDFPEDFSKKAVDPMVARPALPSFHSLTFHPALVVHLID
jgi:hypothetical protein